MTVLETALGYANKGVRVIPIKSGEKRPPMSGWQNAATTDPTTIRQWFEGHFKNCGLGIATGECRDRYLIVVDIDDRAEYRGSDTLADLEELHGKLPPTIEVITGSGGRHIYFLTDTPIRNEASGKLGPGIDIRGVGGQVLAPPTTHPNGKRYEWEGHRSIAQHKPADMPEWMAEILTATPQIEHINKPTSDNILATDGPIQRYNDATTWSDLLIADGWTLSYVDDNNEWHWTRPGKNVREGTSATTNWQGNDKLKVFTTSIPQLQSEHAYDRFEYTMQMHHNGNRDAFIKHIRQGPALKPAEQTRSASELLIKWSEFWNQDFPAEDWLIKPIIPRNQLVVIYAPGGTGKSLLALYISAAIATGRQIFGIDHEPVNVLYMDYEMHQAQLYERLTAMGYNKDTDLSHLHYASLPSISSLDTPEGAKEVCDLAREVQAELVIIDTFSRAVEGAENDADTVRNFYRWTALKLKQDKRALLRIDHAGKDLKKGARGTSAKNDDVDLVWQMTRSGDSVKLVPTKKRHTWINSVDLEVSKSEQMFLQNHVKSQKMDMCLTMMKQANINYLNDKDQVVGQTKLWKAFAEAFPVKEDRQGVVQGDVFAAQVFLTRTHEDAKLFKANSAE